MYSHIEGFCSNEADLFLISPIFLFPECEFVHPTNSSKYFTPTKAFLEKCEKMRGDFILEGRAPSGKIELDKDVCLRLVDVDLTNYKITFSGKGVARCKNGLPSEISGNTGLCKDKLNNLAGYFPKNLVKNISIMPHISCGKWATRK